MESESEPGFQQIVFCIIFVLFSCTTTLLTAQTFSRPQIKKPTLSGDIRAEMQYDGIRGRQQGRPKWIRTLEVTPTISLPNLPTFNLLINISTLESYLRQPFNRFNLQIQPPWGGFYLGDSYPVFSKYSLNGILVRGGSVDINPGLFRLAIAVGQTKRAIKRYGDFPLPNYGQRLYGLKIGVGKKTGTRLNINFVKAGDQLSSLQEPGARKPVENIILGADGFLRLYQGKLTFSGEFAASAYNRDLRSPEISVPDYVPSYATRLFTPTISSQYDLACFLESRLALGQNSFRFKFENIGAGFYSLGTPYLHNDIRRFGLSSTHRLLRNKVVLSLGMDRGRDNLSKLKSATTSTTSGYTNSTVLLSRRTSFTVGYRFYSQRNNDVNERWRVNNLMQSVILAASRQFRIRSFRPSLRLNYFKNWYRNKTPFARPNSDYDTETIRLSGTLRMKSAFSVYASLGYMRNRLKRIAKKDTRWLYNLGISHTALKKRLTSHLRLNYDEGKASNYLRYTDRDSLEYNVRKRWSLSFRSDYRLNNQTISFKLERIIYHDRNYPLYNYREFVVRFIFTRHFSVLK